MQPSVQSQYPQYSSGYSQQPGMQQTPYSNAVPNQYQTTQLNYSNAYPQATAAYPQPVASNQPNYGQYPANYGGYNVPSQMAASQQPGVQQQQQPPPAQQQYQSQPYQYPQYWSLGLLFICFTKEIFSQECFEKETHSCVARID